MRDIAGLILEDISRQRSVGPGGVLRALRERLGPVLSEAELLLLQISGRATWNALWALHPAFVFQGGPQGQREHAIASVIAHVLESVSGSRRARQEHEELFEAKVFRQMREQAASLKNAPPLPQNEPNLQDVWLYRFCKLCFRRRLPGGQLCFEHRPDPDSATSLAKYQNGRRLFPGFNDQVHSLATQEVWRFHNADLDLGVLHPQEQAFKWLELHRPMVCSQLECSTNVQRNNARLWRLVVSVLQPLPGVGVKARAEQQAVNQIFLTHPQLLWPVLVRAEAWLRVDQARRASWGGVRKNAGRRPVATT